MVEGPGCKLKGEKMRGKAVGQTVREVGGAVVDSGPRREAGNPTVFHQLLGHQVSDVKTLGKELFIFFNSEMCVRVHFLMAGFVRYNQVSEDPDEAGREAAAADTPRLTLVLDRDTVGFYQCSVDTRDASEAEARWQRMITLDICWPAFDSHRAAQEIQDPRNEDRLVCDVILDQEILPGVGNIIKNEACFDAGINPLTPVKELSSAHVTRLVKMNRDFSLIFYDCRKHGKPLHKHYKIYNFSKCKQCGGKVTKCKPGEYKRGTYFCSRCQDNSLKSGPMKNSLLSWAVGGGGGVGWSCEICTLLNKPGSSLCSACGEPRNRVTGSKRKSLDNNNSSSSISSSSGSNSSSSISSSSGSNTTGSQAKRIKTDAHPFRTLPPHKENSGRQPGQNSAAPPNGQQRSNNHAAAMANTNNYEPPPVDRCRQHNRPCTVKTVTKEGANRGRLFHTCSLPRGQSCGHFSWADLHHPRCKHGAVTVARAVLKMNENNGRQFFVCPRAKREQCDFFLWKD